MEIAALGAWAEKPLAAALAGCSKEELVMDRVLLSGCRKCRRALHL